MTRNNPFFAQSVFSSVKSVIPNRLCQFRHAFSELAACFQAVLVRRAHGDRAEVESLRITL